MPDKAIAALVRYAQDKGWITEDDVPWAINAVLETVRRDTYTPVADEQAVPQTLDEMLTILLDDAAARGVLPQGSVVYRDLLDTAIMGRLTPPPREVIARFRQLYAQEPRAATDWYYALCGDTNYIRRTRVARDVKWKTETEYGALDITINLSKPEKDPKAIAAARDLPAGDYPRCLLCAQNEGYAGRVNHPARQNHRVIPLTLAGEKWYLQYSPYVYYNEHCIVLNSAHTPMKIDARAFARLLDFVGQFPHYFVGSNADLPIVGGSILAHDHFQGGNYEFAMARAPIETPLQFAGFDHVQAGIVRWPMSVIRLRCAEPQGLVALGERILDAWRGYTDGAVDVFAHTDGVPHNTITPIARRRGAEYELDLVLRNNRTTEQHPLGLFHPHEELHHIKKENIGLIEVMGLAVLPARLKDELACVAERLLAGQSLRDDPMTAAHADWAEQVAARHTLCADNIHAVLRDEVGQVFATVLSHAGVFKRDAQGQDAFVRFASSVR